MILKDTFLKDKLKQYATDEEIEQFFQRLKFNYGDGEILSSEHIINFFSKQMHQFTETDRLGIYIDTKRMLSLFSCDEQELLDCKNKYEVEILHNKLVLEQQENGVEVDQLRKDKFIEATSEFKKWNGTYYGPIKIEAISTIDELNEEGIDMNHCIASYFQIFIDKMYIGFRVHNFNNDERLTLGCRLHEGVVYFNQLKGIGNRPASKESCLHIVEFCISKDIQIIQQEIYDFMPIFQKQKYEQR